MRRILLVLVTAAIVLAIAWGLSDLPGHVSLAFGGTIVETNTPIAALALIIIILVVYTVLKLLAALLRTPRAMGRMRSRRRRRLGDEAITRTLLSLAAGETADARREADRSRRLLGDSPQTLLLVAEAGRAAGREDEAETAFRKLTERKDGAFLGYRGLLRQAIARQDWAEAAALARQADAAHPGTAWLRQERARLAVQAGNWTEALELADSDAPKAAFATAAALAEPDPVRGLRLARDAWKQDPSLVPAALAYAERLRAEGKDSRAQSVLKESWILQPHPDLAEAVLAGVTDKLARAKFAQMLTRNNPDHPESRLLLARTAIEAGLTGEARHQIEAARAAGLNTRRMWLLLAEIEEEERGDTESGRMAQREALRHAASADADAGWRCTNCHTPQPRWQPACPVCGTPGGLRWEAAVTPVLAGLPVVV
jgi:HemY protein